MRRFMYPLESSSLASRSVISRSIEVLLSAPVLLLVLIAVGAKVARSELPGVMVVELEVSFVRR